ncbi:MAG: hypothetical protein ACE5IY_09555 [bacterium]
MKTKDKDGMMSFLKTPQWNWKKILLLSTSLVLLSATEVLAQGRGFGLGIILGEPTGISGKRWLSANTAFDFAAAWSLREDNSLTLHANYLSHNFHLIKVDAGSLPFYYGIGGRIRFDDHDDRFGIRVPLGLNYHFRDITLDAFLEVVPILDLAPETEFDINAALGLRYFFR